MRPSQIKLSDVKKMALLLVLYGGAMAPERYWARACSFLAQARTARSPTPNFGLRECLPPELHQRMGGDSGFLLQRASTRDKEYLQILRHYLPGGWHPAIRVLGTEHLEEALAKGHGAVLWISQFGSFHLVAKMALHGAGYPTWHLSQPEHPFSGTPFGIRFLNPIGTKVEDRYLAGRLLLPPEAENPDGLGVGALRAMLRLLGENKLVSLTVASTAQRLIEVPFFEGQLGLPTAPANLALLAGAPILPVFPLEIAPGSYEVHVARPLSLPREVRRPAAIREALTDYASLLQIYVSSHPSQWVGPLSLESLSHGSQHTA